MLDQEQMQMLTAPNSLDVKNRRLEATARFHEKVAKYLKGADRQAALNLAAICRKQIQS